MATHRNILPIRRREVSELTARQLECEIGSTIIILEREHFSDGRPFCIETVMLLEERYPGVFEGVFSGQETLSEAYSRHGIDIAKCEQTVATGMLSGERRTRLDLPPDQPALIIERVGRSAAGDPLDLRMLYFRGDQFALRQEIIYGSSDKRVL